MGEDDGGEWAQIRGAGAKDAAKGGNGDAGHRRDIAACVA